MRPDLPEEGSVTTEPISDGTMPCPVPSPDTGHPCVKTIPRGWTAEEGHGGGHFWQAPAITRALDAGAHYDAGRLLAGEAVPWHLPEDCTPACAQAGSSPAGITPPAAVPRCAGTPSTRSCRSASRRPGCPATACRSPRTGSAAAPPPIWRRRAPPRRRSRPPAARLADPPAGLHPARRRGETRPVRPCPSRRAPGPGRVRGHAPVGALSGSRTMVANTGESGNGCCSPMSW